MDQPGANRQEQQSQYGNLIQLPHVRDENWALSLFSLKPKVEERKHSPEGTIVCSDIVLKMSEHLY